jgi:hypothetical protein
MEAIRLDTDLCTTPKKPVQFISMTSFDRSRWNPVDDMSYVVGEVSNFTEEKSEDIECKLSDSFI